MGTWALGSGTPPFWHKPGRVERVGPEDNDQAEGDKAKPQGHEMARVAGEHGSVEGYRDGVVHCSGPGAREGNKR